MANASLSSFGQHHLTLDSELSLSEHTVHVRNDATKPKTFDAIVGRIRYIVSPQVDYVSCSSLPTNLSLFVYQFAFPI